MIDGLLDFFGAFLKLQGVKIVGEDGIKMDFSIL